MKKILYKTVVLLIAALNVSSCTEEEELVSSDSISEIVMTVADFVQDVPSRTNLEITSSGANFSWAETDTVGIFPHEGAQAYFPMISGAGTKSASFTGGGWALKSSANYAAYYPYNFFNRNRENISLDFRGQLQDGNASTAHLGMYDYMAAVSVTPNEGVVNFTFEHLCALVRMQVSIAGLNNLSSITLQTDEKVFPIKGKINLSDETVAIVPMETSNTFEITAKNIEVTEDNQTATVYFMMPPVNLLEKSLKAIIKNAEGNSLEVSLTPKNFEAGKAYALGAESITEYHVAIPGTLEELIGADLLRKLTAVRITGYLNGTDFGCIRGMAGCDGVSSSTDGKLVYLDISDATIVEGGNAYYSTINSGTHYTENYIMSDMMFYGCKLETVITPKNTIEINGGFRGCKYLTSVTIPDGVKRIGNDAFHNCEALSSIVIPASVTSIGNHAFYGCNFTSLEIPSSVTSIGRYAFSSSPNLETVNIPEGITSIEQGTFYNCPKLQPVTIPSSVKSIGESAFYACSNISSITIPESVTNIGSRAFEHSGLESIVLPESITKIGYRVFENCRKLVSVTIPESVTYIDSGAFRNCFALVTIKIPDSVTELDEGSFCGCGSLTSVKLPVNLPTIPYCCFQDCINLTDIVLPENLGGIESLAFKNCTKLSSINIPTKRLNTIGSEAFANTGLTSIHIPDNVTTILERAFMDCKELTSVTLSDNLLSIGNWTFGNCVKLSSITLPDKITTVSACLFYGCTALSNITLPQNVTYIKGGAFYGCTSLEDITLPENIVSIDGDAFDRCTSLNKIYCMPNTPPGVTESFYEPLLETCTLYVPSGTVDSYKAAIYWQDFVNVVE